MTGFSEKVNFKHQEKQKIEKKNYNNIKATTE